MTRKCERDEVEVVVATVGDRTYSVPARFDFDVSVPSATRRGSAGAVHRGPGAGYIFVGGVIRIREGRVTFDEVRVQMDSWMAPQDMQSVPWGKIAELAVAMKAAGWAAGAPAAAVREVHSARSRSKAADRATRARQRERAGAPAGRNYRRDRADLYREVLRLRSEAEGLGKRYDTYVGGQLGYQPAYVRRLAGQAAAARDRGDL